MRISWLKPLRMAGVPVAALSLSAVLHGATPGIPHAVIFPSAALSTVLDESLLQSPTGYTGIYVNWNMDIDNDATTGDAAGKDNPWDFGTRTQYPVLRHGSHNIGHQRRS